jgi:hypothetical protein
MIPRRGVRVEAIFSKLDESLQDRRINLSIPEQFDQRHASRQSTNESANTGGTKQCCIEVASPA